MANAKELKESTKKFGYVIVTIGLIAAAVWYFPWTAAGVGLTGLIMIVLGKALPRDPIGTSVRPKPSRRTAKVITDEETLLWESRQHPISLWRWWLGLMIVPSVLIHVTIATNIVDWKIAIITILTGATALSIRIWLWRVDRICLTDKRILTVTGILLRNNKMMPAGKLTDLTVVTPRLSTILSGVKFIQAPYTTIIAESAGQDQALNKIWYIPEGSKLEHLIVDLTQ